MSSGMYLTRTFYDGMLWNMTGEEMRALLKALGLSQGQAAEAIGLQRQAISRYVNDHSRIPRVVEVALKGLTNGGTQDAGPPDIA